MSLSKEIPLPASGFKRLWKATFYSIDGLRSAYVNESAFRTELGLALVTGPLTFFLDAPLIYKLLVWMSLGIVLVTEILNSAIEAVVDMTAGGYHPLAKRAKDMASAAVFLSLWIFAMTFSVVLWQAFFA